MDECDDERAEELSSIAAIYPEILIDEHDEEHGDLKASLELEVAPLEPLKLVSAGTEIPAAPPIAVLGAQKSQLRQEAHELSHLPPLKLEISLPKGYPENKPPSISLGTTPSWISQERLQEMQAHALFLWEDYGRTMVLFAYIDWIQQCAERAFDVVANSEQSLELPQSTKISMLDFDIQAKRRKFEQGTFDCGVCLEPKKGSKCHRMNRCGHVFCVSCLQDFYNNCIAEGDVNNVKCLDPECGKQKANDRIQKSRHIQPSELLQIPIRTDVVSRYVHMKRKKRVEADKSTVYCPREWCQGPARSSKVSVGDTFEDLADSDDEEALEDGKADPTKGDRLAVCSDCNYAFCRVCLSGWHGDFVRCGPRNPEELSSEEKATYDYLHSRTVPCPTCSSPAQKTQGCNHMTCFQCRTHFCYLCGSWLDKDNPYAHFNQIGKTCYMRLWELETGDEDDAAAAERNNDDPLVELQEEELAMVARALNLDGAADNHLAAPAVNIEQNANNVVAPPPAPAPPRAAQRRHNNRNARGPARRAPVNQPAAAPAAAAAGANPAGRAEDAVRALREGGRPGLARFLAMVQNDEEDDWDSDELSDDDEEFAALR